MRIVIDTNIFFPAFNPNSRYYPIVKGLLAGEFTLLISTPILLEYEEILQKVFAANLLEQFWLFLLTADNIAFINPHFSFQLPISDEDDQKFVDCAICGNADFLLTNDKHFKILKYIEFPRLSILTGELFIEKFLN